MTVVKAPNFTAAQETLIRDAAPLNFAKAGELAAMPEMNTSDGSPRKVNSVVAKARSLGVDYTRKAVASVTKAGDPVEKKIAIVKQISDLIEANLDGLEVAPKSALQALRDFIKAA